MKNRTNDDKLVSRFLLGDVTEEQKAQLEERFFSDDEYFDYMLAIEDELIDDYAQGALSERQREMFEKHFLNSPARLQRVAFAQALQKTANLVEPARQPVEREAKPWWQSLLGLFGLQNPALQMALGALAIVLMVGCSWLIFESARLRNQLAQAETARLQQEKEAAEQFAEQRSQNQQLAADLERERNERQQVESELTKEREHRDNQSSGGISALVSFVLSAGLVRDDQGARQLALPSSAAQVRLQLKLRRTGDYKGYRAALQTLDGVPVATPAATKSGGSGNAVVVTLPARVLKSGDYKLSLTGLTEAGDFEAIDSYYFRVVKK
jgi:hypothetical protein